MTSHVAIQAPIVESESVELAKNSRIFRKEVLKVGKINYKGDVLDFTESYLDGLVLAHQDGVFPVVPLVFAPDDNRHTQDVERIRGEILGFERNAAGGLDAIVQASNDKAAQLLRENPKIGCSVRIEQPINRADGKSWPAAVQHVLATANPVFPGLTPWQPVDLAVDDLPVIDLSIYDFADGEDEENTMADKPVPLSDEETARLRQLLSQLEGTEVADETEDDGYVLPSDDEMAQIAASLLADDDETEDEVVQDELVEIAASNDSHAIELANRVDAQAIELATLRAERDAERYARLRDQLAHTDGIPPHITELAKPLLLGRNVVELSSGASVDAGETILKVMKALAASKLVDLSNGVVYDTPKSAEEDSAVRESEAADYLKTFGLR